MFSVTVPILTKKKFSDETGISVKTVERLIGSGVLPIIKVSDRITYINVAKLTSDCLARAKKENCKAEKME